MFKKNGSNSSRGSLAPTIIWWVVVAFLALSVIYPSIRLILNSLKVGDGYGLDNYVTVFSDPGILKSMKNSFIVVIPADDIFHHHRCIFIMGSCPHQCSRREILEKAPVYSVFYPSFYRSDRMDISVRTGRIF